jgi:Tfp pilus assembly protein PilO
LRTTGKQLSAGRRPWVFGLLTLLILNAAVFLAFTLPRRLQEQNVAARVETLKAEVQRERRLVTDLQKRADAVKANGVDQEHFFKDTVARRAAAYVPTLQEIEAMASGPGLRPGSRNYSTEEVKGLPLQEVRIALPLEGTYRQLVAFVRNVERSKRFLTLDRIQLRQGKSEGSPSGVLTVQLSAYFHEEPEAPRAQ